MQNFLQLFEGIFRGFFGKNPRKIPREILAGIPGTILEINPGGMLGKYLGRSLWGPLGEILG